jgi:hypothetical protein
LSKQRQKEKYQLQGVKRDNFEDFKKVAYSCSEHQKFSLLQSSALMQSKAHLTREGLEEIRKKNQVFYRLSFGFSSSLTIPCFFYIFYI